MTSTRFIRLNETQHMKQSHAFLLKFEELFYFEQLHTEREELIVINFRPAWLIPQKFVYAALASSTCHICMYDYFVEFQEIQHDHRHPVVCQKCFKRIRSCPFCRIPLEQFYKFE